MQRIYIVRTKLLQYNIGLMSWRWDVSEIERLTMATANVVDLLRSEMEKLSDNVRHVLSVAAILGSSFDVNLLTIIWGSFMPKANAKYVSGFIGWQIV